MTDDSTTLGGNSGKLRVFISWSLPLAEKVAEIFGDWLEGVIQDVEAWVSTDDIEKGKWWNQEVIDALTSSSVGVVIMTPVNLARPWLNFEAGALTGAIKLAGGIVAPLLINVPGSSMTGPINGLQVTRFEEVLFGGNTTARYSNKWASGWALMAGSDARARAKAG
jgi:hypothetical protein